MRCLLHRYIKRNPISCKVLTLALILTSSCGSVECNIARLELCTRAHYSNVFCANEFRCPFYSIVQSTQYLVDCPHLTIDFVCFSCRRDKFVFGIFLFLFFIAFFFCVDVRSFILFFLFICVSL